MSNIQEEYKDSRNAFEVYKNKIIDILKSNSADENILRIIKSKNSIDLLNFYLEEKLKKFHDILLQNNIFLKNRVPNRKERNIYPSDEFKNIIIEYLQQVNVNKKHITEIKKINTREGVISYCNTNLKKYLDVLKEKNVKGFLVSHNQKNIYTKIIYTPMGNKR